MITGDCALLEAAKKGNLARVQKLATPDNINCRDSQGRNSTPLHLAGKENVGGIRYEARSRGRSFPDTLAF